MTHDIPENGKFFPSPSNLVKNCPEELPYREELPPLGQSRRNILQIRVRIFYMNRLSSIILVTSKSSNKRTCTIFVYSYVDINILIACVFTPFVLCFERI